MLFEDAASVEDGRKSQVSNLGKDYHGFVNSALMGEALAGDVAEQGAWRNWDVKRGTQQQGLDGTREQEG